MNDEQLRRFYEVALCVFYATTLNHGAPGHNRMMLIADLVLKNKTGDKIDEFAIKAARAAHAAFYKVAMEANVEIYEEWQQIEGKDA